MTTTLPCVDGESLTQYVARTGKLPALQALALVGQLLAALDQAHRSGMAHPGFTEDDLVVTRAGRLALTSWAIAQRGPPGLHVAMQNDLFAAAGIAKALLGGVQPALDIALARALSPALPHRYGTAPGFWHALWTAMGPPVWERPEKPALVLDDVPAANLPPVVRPVAAVRPAPVIRPAPVVQPAPAVRPAPQQAPKDRRFAFALAATAAVAFVAIAAGSALWRQAPAEVQAAAAIAPADGIEALLQREAPLPREEVVAGSVAALEPRDLPQPVAAPVPEADRLRTAPVTRPARSEAPRTVTASRTTQGRPQQVAHRLDPNLGCDQQFVITREVCKISKCETDAYSRHPVCRSMRDEQRRRDLVAEQTLRTR